MGVEEKSSWKLFLWFALGIMTILMVTWELIAWNSYRDAKKMINKTELLIQKREQSLDDASAGQQQRNQKARTQVEARQRDIHNDLEDIRIVFGSAMRELDEPR